MPTPAPRPSRRSALLLWVIAAAGLILSAFISIPISMLFPGMNPDLESLVNILAYYLPFIALPVFLLTRRNPALLDAYRPNPISLFNTISVVLLALIGVLVVSDISALWSIVLQAFGFTTASTNFAIPTTSAGLTMSIFTTAVLPAVCEEFLFRGVILSGFEGTGGTRRAVLASAALFTLLHGWIVGLPAQFLMGYVIATVVVCCDSIYAGLIYHTTHNAASILLQYVATRSAPADAAAETASMLQALGGLAGVLSLLMELLIIGAVFAFTLRWFRLRAQLTEVEFLPPRRERLQRRERVYLILGLAIVGLLYALDFAAMLG